MKKGAIFDMDGLLFDTETLYQRGWTIIADEFGVDKNMLKSDRPDFPPMRDMPVKK